MLKNSKPILIVSGESKSIFFEIFFKSLKFKKFKSPIILISSHKLLRQQIKKFKFRKKIKLIDLKDVNNIKLNNDVINLINVKYNNLKKNEYIENSFEIAFNLIKKGITNKLINGPINKKSFLKKKFLGITEFISQKFKKKKIAMLIYNKDLSVCPITTHLPLKLVAKTISQKLIFEKTELIYQFYKKNLGIKPKIAVTGLNPHCESILNLNEDKLIVSPAIKTLKKLGYNVDGPFSADTIFLRQNRKKYDVIVGMYHDQVLSPMKTLLEYDAINITLGLPFLRISPDHGPNAKMLGKNSSDPTSLTWALKFLDK